MRIHRLRGLRGLGFVALVLVSCLHDGGPPTVVPTATLGVGSADGAPRGVAPFGIAFSGPRGELTTDREAIATTLFNRSMRLLDASDDASSIGATIVRKDGTTPPGRWAWVGTRGLVFEANDHLAASTDYDVMVPATAASLDGATLGVAHRFSFSTTTPRVLSAPFSGTRDVRPNATLRLEFDQPIDPADVQRATTLTAQGPTTEAPKPLAFTVRRASGVARDKLSRTVEIVPTGPLPTDRRLEVIVGKGLKGAEGPRTTPKPQTFTARSYGPLRLEDIVCTKATLGRCMAGQSIEVRLSNAVEPSDFLAHLDVGGGEPARLLLEKTRSVARPKLTIVRAAKAGKRYRVTIRKGLHDVFGQVLERDLVVDVDVEAPFVGGTTPGSVATPSYAMATDAAGSPPPGPHRAQLAYEAQIGVRGYVVEAATTEGIKSHRVPIGTVNVPTIGTYAGAFPESDLLHWLDASIASGGPHGAGWTWEWNSSGVGESIRAVKTIDVDALLGGPGRHGAALLALAIPGAGAPSQSTVLSVTDLAVTARMSKLGGLVWVTRLSNGLAVDGAEVKVLRLHPTKGQAVEAFNGKTDAAGLVTISSEKYDPIGASTYGPSSDAVVVVRSGDDWTFQQVLRGRASASSWWEVDLTQRTTYRGLLFTERGVYRPGEHVKLAGVVRRNEGAEKSSISGKFVHIAVTDAEGVALAKATAKLDEFGTFSVDLTLPKTAKLGSATFTALVARSEPGEREPTFTTSVLLAAYRASAFKIDVDLARDKAGEAPRPYIRGDNAKLTIGGEYLYGAPMDGASVRTTVTRAPVAFTPPHADGFLFGEEGLATYASAGSLESPAGALDEKGAFEASIKLAMTGMRTTERVTAEAEVEDPTRQTVAKTTSALVHPAEFYLGVQRDGGRFVRVKAAASLSALEIKPQVAAFEPTGKRRAGVSVTFELVKRSWSTAIAEQYDGSAMSSSASVDTVVATCSVTTTATVAGCPLSVRAVGYYVLRARAVDPRGNEARVSSSLYVITEEPDASPKATTAWARTDLKTVKLEAEKPSYRVGDTARVLVRNPFKRAEALVTIERAGILTRKTMTLEGPMPVVEIPVESSWFPNVFVTVDLVRGRVQAPPVAGLDLGGPEFRVGTTELKIDPESHRLKVAITPSKNELAPGETFTADVAIAGSDGKPTQASVTFYAVDEGVLMLTGYRTPDPLVPFSERYPLGVFGFESRENLASIMAMRAGEKVPILGWETPSEGWAKGSAYGGGGEGSEATPRADFRATAFFEGGRVTGTDGHARFEVKLPDNLTSYRLMAVASARDDRFGFGQEEIKASKSLMLRPAIPRALRVGDAFEATFIVATKGLAAGDVDVTIKPKAGTAAALAIDGPTTMRAHFTPGAQLSVRFPARAVAPGEASFDVEARSGALVDRVVLTRKIEQPMTLQTVASYGETTKPVAIALGDLKGMSPLGGGLKVSLASSALVGLESSFEQLAQYPYGCTEQVASRTLPLLSMVELARDAGARLPAHVDEAIDDGVVKLLAHQSATGGFGYWEDDEPVPWLSAYATMVLEEADKKGRSVPAAARERAITYLRERALRYAPIAAAIIDATDVKATKTSTDDDAPDDGTLDDERASDPETSRRMQLASFAMILDALASSHAPDPGLMDRLFEARAKMPLFASALLLHAMAVGKMPQESLTTFAAEIVGRLRVGANEVVAAPEGPVLQPMLDSNARTTALVLRALLAVDPKHPLASRLARGLLNARVAGAWNSTQETVWALLALDAYRAAQEPTAAAFEARAFLGDQPVLALRFDGQRAGSALLPASSLTTGAPLTFDVVGDVAGTGTLFYAAELRYASTVLPTQPLDRGLFIDKRVRGLAAADLAEALKAMPKSRAAGVHDRVKVGQLVLIDLIVETAEARDQVVIDDPLPSGVEPVDVRVETVSPSHDVAEGAFLAHAAGVGPTPVATIPLALHREHRDDRVLTFLGHLAPGLYHFRYLARATALGTYVVPPTRIEAMYSPEIAGRTAASTLEVVRE